METAQTEETGKAPRRAFQIMSAKNKGTGESFKNDTDKNGKGKYLR